VLKYPAKIEICIWINLSYKKNFDNIFEKLNCGQSIIFSQQFKANISKIREIKIISLQP
jgi:hypothetical protein